MLIYTLRRLLYAIPIVIGVMFIIFWIFQLSPIGYGPSIELTWNVDMRHNTHVLTFCTELVTCVTDLRGV